MKLIKFFISVTFSLIGCAYQVYYISDQFFTYPTSTKITLTNQNVSVIPTITFCSSAPSLFKHPGVSYRNITIFELFNRTPSVESFVIQGILVGVLSKDNLFFFQSDYGKLYTVEKRLRKYDVCYTIKFNESLPFNFFTVVSSYSSYIAQIVLEASVLDKASKQQFFINHPSSPIHVSSFTFAEVRNHERNKTLRKYQTFDMDLTYTEYENIYLESPYDTHCKDYRPKYPSHHHCYDDCVLKSTLKAFNWVPLEITKNYPFKSMTPKEWVEDPSWSTKFKRIHTLMANCSNICKKAQCHTIVYVPFMTYTLRKDNNGIIEFFPSPDPLFKTVSEPKINWIDFITYILSCLGFWFGVSCHGSINMIGKNGNNKDGGKVKKLLEKEIRMLEIKMIRNDDKIMEKVVDHMRNQRRLITYRR